MTMNTDFKELVLRGKNTETINKKDEWLAEVGGGKRSLDQAVS